jgi:hypothetical protein
VGTTLDPPECRRPVKFRERFPHRPRAQLDEIAGLDGLHGGEMSGLKPLFFGVTLSMLPISLDTAQPFDSICNDAAQLSGEVAEHRNDSTGGSIDDILLKHFAENRPLGAKLDPNPIFSELNSEAISFAYSDDAKSLTATQVRHRFYSLCWRHFNSQ